MMLCQDDVTKIDQVTEININQALTYMSYIKERNKLNSK